MNTANWLPYYVLYMQQQQRARKAEEERQKEEEARKQAEAETQRAREEAEQKQQEKQVVETPPIEQTVEKSRPTEELKPTENTNNTAKPTYTYTPKPTDCELLYEIGSSDYALCENTKAQNAAVNSNIAVIFMCCLVGGLALAAIIVHCVDRSVDRKYGKGDGGGFTFYG